jgi:hypothetical protein
MKKQRLTKIYSAITALLTLFRFLLPNNKEEEKRNKCRRSFLLIDLTNDRFLFSIDAVTINIALLDCQ